MINACKVPRCRSPVTRDGYCGTHHPDAVARRAARLAARRVEQLQSMQQYMHEEVEQRLRAALFDELLAALRPFAAIPVEEFGWLDKPDQPVHEWNGHTVYVRDVLAARAVLRKAAQR